MTLASASGGVTDPWSIGAVDGRGGWAPDPAAGLTSVEATARLQRVGANRLDPTPPVPAWRKLLAFDGGAG